MFSAIPIDMISEPNVFAPLPNSEWVLTNPNAQSLWFTLSKSDTLSTRRYIPTAGSSLVVIFQRRDDVQINGIRRNRLESTSQSVTKTAVVSTDDKSMYKIDLTTTDVQTILSGTVKFTLTEDSADNTWVQNWAIRKNLTDAGF